MRSFSSSSPSFRTPVGWFEKSTSSRWVSALLAYCDSAQGALWNWRPPTVDGPTTEVALETMQDVRFIFSMKKVRCKMLDSHFCASLQRLFTQLITDTNSYSHKSEFLPTHSLTHSLTHERKHVDMGRIQCDENKLIENICTSQFRV